MKTEPTEALANQTIKKITDSLIFEINYEEDNYDAGYSAALHNHGEALYMMGFSEGQSDPKIKQLEWREGDFYTIADTPFGVYKMPKPIYTESTFLLCLDDKAITVSYGIDEAKATAQADFEKRVKGCLIT